MSERGLLAIASGHGSNREQARSYGSVGSISPNKHDKRQKYRRKEDDPNPFSTICFAQPRM
jgi:hypothetical protein